MREGLDFLNMLEHSILRDQFSNLGGGLRRLQDNLKTEERKKEDARGLRGSWG